MTAPLLGTVAVVGFPNVGKSTLVNRLSATREAVVFETPGVTRDRKEVVCEWAGKRFVLVDTGGVDVADRSPMTREVAEQARRAVEEADLVLFVTDARVGVTPGDEEIASAAPGNRSSSSPTRWTTRAATRTRWSSTVSGSVSRCPFQRCMANRPAICSTGSSKRFLVRRERKRERMRSESRSSGGRMSANRVY
jgi:hypothetical protein